ncbi:hypothetical protein NT239_11570 [Chitinibacter sp. SCUT-21]|uniref:hypothetical protein n=1 Tax=Chitinibacter sp. SCUT-21 TaxID=2970891 RepID=UPI0035A715D3
MQNILRTTVLPICAMLTLALSVPVVQAGPRAVGGGGGKAAAARPAPKANMKSAPKVSNNRAVKGNKVASGNTVNKGNNKVNIDNSKRNVNVDNNRNVNVNVNGNGGCHHGCGGWYDDDDWDVGQAIVTTAAVVGTAAVIGSIVNSVPSNCVPVNINGITYQQCGSTWYQPQYSGSTVNYIVVNAPR